MGHASWTTLSRGRVNPVVPAAVAVAGFVLLLAGNRNVGLGVAIGAGLALLNGAFLSRRVDLAATVGDVGRALLLMQLGLVVTCTVVGVTTVILVHFSVALAVAAAAGFVVAQLGMLAAFYLTSGRSLTKMESEPS